jgi:iron complex outermembrane receptor protein
MRISNLAGCPFASCERKLTRVRWPAAIVAGIFGMASLAFASDPGPPVSMLKKLSFEELLDVEVMSVSRRTEKLADAASAVQVVTGDEIRRSGASSIPEALRLADNLQVAQKNSHDWGISARGFNTELSNKLLVLRDGRTVYTPLYSGVFWDVQDYLLADIERIEVISGPGGTLWGANAVNGVINIITKEANATQGFLAEAGGGTELRSFAGARYGGTLAPGVFFRVYGKYSERDDGVIANGNDSPTSWHMGQGGLRIDTEASRQNRLTLQTDFYRGVENQAVGGDSRTSGGNILGRWAHTVSEDTDMALQAYYDRTHFAAFKPANGFTGAGTLADDLDTFDVDFQHRFRLGKNHRVIWGLGYRFTHDVVSNAPSVAFLPARLDQDLFSGFLQDEITLRSNLFFTLGTKIEHNDYTGYETEPGIRLQWNSAPGQMVWSAISRSVRMPSRIDRNLTEPTGLAPPLPQSILNGGPDFASETVVAYELGYRAQLGGVSSASISTFYNDYDHLRSTTPAPAGFPSFGFPLVFHNNLEGETYGFELSVAYEARPGWRLRGGYNLLKERLRVKSGQVDFSNALNETADPQQQFTVRSSWDLPHRLELDAALRWVDTLHNNNGPTPGTVPSYFELDVRLGFRPTDNLEFSVVGQNLLNDHHPEYGFPSPTRDEASRGVYGKLTWRY